MGHSVISESLSEEKGLEKLLGFEIITISEMKAYLKAFKFSKPVTKEEFEKAKKVAKHFFEVTGKAF